MLRRALPSLAVAGIAVLALATPGGALGKHAPSKRAFCSKTGDYCIGINHATSSPRLLLTTFSFTGTYTLCVAPAGQSATCHDFRLRKGKFGLYHSNVGWAAHFPPGLGRHRVTWSKDGKQIGHALHFTLKKPFIASGKGNASAGRPGAPRT